LNHRAVSICDDGPNLQAE